MFADGREKYYLCFTDTLTFTGDYRHTTNDHPVLNEMYELELGGGGELLISIFSFQKFSLATFSFLVVSLERNFLLYFGTRCLTQSFSCLYWRVA